MAREFFGEAATVEQAADGIGVTAADARERGTDLLVALRDAGVPVTGFNVRAPTLDDVFLAITDGDVGDTAAPDSPTPAVEAER